MNIKRLFRFPANLPPHLRSNFIHLFFDIGWWGLYVGTTAAFLSIYAARNGATAEQLGLLSAVPALISLLLSLPAGRLLRRWPARPATAAAAFLSRAPLLLFALLPWLLPKEIQVSAILVTVAVIALPTTLIGISFTQFFIEGVPLEWRGMVVGMRNAIMSIISFAVTVAAGQILTLMPFPGGYQVVFFIGAVGAVMTSYHIYHVYPVEDTAQTAAALPGNETPAPAKRFGPRNLGPEESNYLRVIGLLFLFNLTNNMVAPLIPNLLVHRLGLSDAMISVGTGLANMLVFSVSLFMANLTRRVGNRRATAFGAMLLSLHAVALALAGSPAVYLLSALIGGIASGILGTAQYNYHINNVPGQARSTWLAWNFLLGNSAVLLGALVGPQIARLTGTSTALEGFGILRFLFGAMILVWG